MKPLRNQAQLSINGQNTIRSNVAYGEIREVLSIAKKATPGTYGENRPVTFVITMANSSTSDFTNISLVDDLGRYPLDLNPERTVVPLSYVPDTILYYVNNELQTAAPVPVETDASLTISGINIPAGGTASIIYQAYPNEFAPRTNPSSITNTVTITNLNAITASDNETIYAEYKPLINLTKSINPVPVTENERVTYTFLFENSGPAPLAASDLASFTDTFDPPISDLEVTFNGAVLLPDDDYNYDAASGAFSTTAGRLTVPEAVITQNPDTGVINVTPGTSTLTISGIIPGTTA